MQDSHGRYNGNEVAIIGASVRAPGAPDLETAKRALAMSWEASGDDLLVRARMREW